MRKQIIPFVGLAFLLWLVAGLIWYKSYRNNARYLHNTEVNTFSFTHNNFDVSAQDNFYFPVNSADLVLGNQSAEAIKALSNYANTHQLEITLTGLQSSSESGVNLGKKRAESVQRLLSESGLPQDQINTKGMVVNNRSDQSKMNHAMLISVASSKPQLSDVQTAPNKALSGDQLPKVVKASLQQVSSDEDTPVPALNLYFPNKVYKLKETPDILAYINQLKAFIASNPKAKIILTGFTDNQGDYETNMTISRRRARSVRNFLVQNGIKKNNTEFTYHGPQAPIASNETEEGRKVNRRVEIRIEY